MAALTRWPLSPAVPETGPLALPCVRCCLIVEPMAAPSPVDTLARIETPENVWLIFHLAGPATRMLAYLLDFLIRVAVTFVLVFLIGLLAPLFVVTSLPIALVLVYAFFLEWGYFTVFEAFWNGQTPGKRLLRLRVVHVGGYPIGFYDSLLRNLLRAADVLPGVYAVGLITMMATRRLQRLGDLVASTIVIREQRTRLRGKLPQLRDVEPFSPAELGSAYEPSERTLVLIDSFFRRRHELPGVRSEEIAAILAGPLANRLGYAGDEDEDLRTPARFLLRVLRTFSGSPPFATEAHGGVLSTSRSGGVP